MLLCIAHPLEGKRYFSTPVQPSESFYGSDALFIFDPENEENRPLEKIQALTIKAWNALPQYMKDTFERAFGQEVLHDSKKCLTEQEWNNVLLRFKNELEQND